MGQFKPLTSTYVSQLPEYGLDAVPDGILGVAHLVDEVGHEGDRLQVVHMVVRLCQEGEHLLEVGQAL